MFVIARMGLHSSILAMEWMQQLKLELPSQENSSSQDRSSELRRRQLEVQQETISDLMQRTLQHFGYRESSTLNLSILFLDERHFNPSIGRRAFQDHTITLILPPSNIDTDFSVEEKNVALIHQLYQRKLYVWTQGTQYTIAIIISVALPLILPSFGLIGSFVSFCCELSAVLLLRKYTSLASFFAYLIVGDPWQKTVDFCEQQSISRSGVIETILNPRRSLNR